MNRRTSLQAASTAGLVRGLALSAAWAYIPQQNPDGSLTLQRNLRSSMGLTAFLTLSLHA